MLKKYENMIKLEIIESFKAIFYTTKYLILDIHYVYFIKFIFLYYLQKSIYRHNHN